MTRFGSLILCATLGNALLACGSNTPSTTKDPLDLVPGDTDLPGWTVDQDHNQSPGQRAMVAHTLAEVTALIDGGSGDYFFDSYKPTEFLWQNYKNSTLASAPDGAIAKLYILQMPSEDQASGLYTAILKFSDHKGNVWQDPLVPAVGAQSRIQDTGAKWWINFRQGVYYVEILVDPSLGPSPDFVASLPETKQQAILFAQKIVSKM